MDLPGLETGLRIRGGLTPADTHPVAEVLIESPVRHLARTFDYGVPAPLDADVKPGVRVRVTFAGRKLAGFVVARKDSTDHAGDVSPIDTVVSPVEVLTPELLTLCTRVASKFAGTVPDVVRLAIPPRHAAGETTAVNAEPQGGVTFGELPPAISASEQDFLLTLGAWSAESNAEAGPRAAFCVPAGAKPGLGWIHAVLRAAQVVTTQGKSVLIVVPDQRSVERVARLIKGDVVTLTHEQGPQSRWSAWVKAATGKALTVVGTRASAFVPMPDLGLIVLCCDDHDGFIEPRAPYCHARSVVLERVAATQVATLFVDSARSVETQRLVETGWMGNVDVPRNRVRELSPLVLDAGFTRSIVDLTNLPARAFDLIRQALGRQPGERGPVLVQVPRTGYITTLLCEQCRAVLTCRCGVPLRAASLSGPFACPVCGFHTEHVTCHTCGAHQFRSAGSGLDGVHFELGKAFPGYPVIRSGGSKILDTVEPIEQIVVATTGAEPYVEGGYALALLFDTLWPGPSLRSTGQAIARRMQAASLVRPAPGKVLVLDENPDILRTLVHFDPVGWASHELGTREHLRMPPAVRVCEISGTRTVVDATVGLIRGVDGVRLFEERSGPPRSHYTRTTVSEDDGAVTAVLGIERTVAAQVAHTLGQATTSASLHNNPMPRVRFDDPDAL